MESRAWLAVPLVLAVLAAGFWWWFSNKSTGTSPAGAAVVPLVPSTTNRKPKCVDLWRPVCQHLNSNTECTASAGCSFDETLNTCTQQFTCNDLADAGYCEYALAGPSGALNTEVNIAVNAKPDRRCYEGEPGCVDFGQTMYAPVYQFQQHVPAASSGTLRTQNSEHSFTFHAGKLHVVGASFADLFNSCDGTNTCTTSVSVVTDGKTVGNVDWTLQNCALTCARTNVDAQCDLTDTSQVHYTSYSAGELEQLHNELELAINQYFVPGKDDAVRATLLSYEQQARAIGTQQLRVPQATASSTNVCSLPLLRAYSEENTRGGPPMSRCRRINGQLYVLHGLTGEVNDDMGGTHGTSAICIPTTADYLLVDTVQRRVNTATVAATPTNPTMTCPMGYVATGVCIGPNNECADGTDAAQQIVGTLDCIEMQTFATSPINVVYNAAAASQEPTLCPEGSAVTSVVLSDAAELQSVACARLLHNQAICSQNALERKTGATAIAVISAATALAKQRNALLHTIENELGATETGGLDETQFNTLLQPTTSCGRYHGDSSDDKDARQNCCCHKVGDKRCIFSGGQCTMLTTPLTGGADCEFVNLFEDCKEMLSPKEPTPDPLTPETGEALENGSG